MTGSAGRSDTYQFVYFVGVDNNSHTYVGDQASYAQAVRNVNDALGMTVILPSRGWSRDADQFDVLLVTDHGQAGSVVLGGRGHGFRTPDETFITHDLVVVDAVAGGSGRDRLTGDEGPDCFVFAAPCGRDVIRNFDLAKDAILLDVDLARNERAVRKVAEAYDGGVRLKFSEDDIVKVKGVDMGDLRKIDFLFHDI